MEGITKNLQLSLVSHVCSHLGRPRERSDPKDFRVCNFFSTVALIKMSDKSVCTGKCFIRKKQERCVGSSVG